MNGSRVASRLRGRRHLTRASSRRDRLSRPWLAPGPRQSSSQLKPSLASRRSRLSLETFTKAREFVENRGYVPARQKSISELDLASIDDPITDIVKGFSALPHCFTLQCCFGHFICSTKQDRHNIDPIPLGFSGLATYRIAYVALCLENCRRGQALRQSLGRLPAVDPDYVQFGSADWFWERWVNSYALQVEPKAHMLKDEAILGSTEALRTQTARDHFFEELRILLAIEQSEHEAG